MSDEPFRDANRRAFARTAIRLPATVVCGDARIPVQTVDLGLGGMCFVAPRPIGPGSRCTVTLALPVEHGNREISASLKVVYSSYLAAAQFKIGTVFTALDDDAAQVLGRYTSAS